jgi:hypothetical protein
MAEFTIEGPEGQSFTIEGPDNQMLDPSERAARRTQESVRPEGGRQEGAATAWAVGAGEKFKSDLEHLPSDLYHHPENFIGPGEIGGGLMGIMRGGGGGAGRFLLRETPEGWEIHDQHGLIVGGLSEQDAMNRMARINGEPPPAATTPDPRSAQQPDQPPQPEHMRVRLYDDALTAGRISLEEWQGFMDAMGRSGRAPPTAAPAREAFQGPPASTQPAAPPVISQQRGFLGGGRQENEAFERYIAPHANEQEFAERYFGGMYNRFINFEFVQRGYEINGPELSFRGPLIANGRNVGRITRTIYPENGVAFNNYLALNENQQGRGIAKRLLSGQVDIYQQMNLDRVEVSTGLDRGGYAWARYGFLPSEEEWREVRYEASDRVRPILNDLTSTERVLLWSVLKMNDPHAIWALAQLATPVGANEVPLGKYLLSGNDWHGTLDLKDPVTMEKFDNYVGRKKK